METPLYYQRWFANSALLFVHTEPSSSAVKMHQCVNSYSEYTSDLRLWRFHSHTHAAVMEQHDHSLKLCPSDEWTSSILSISALFLSLSSPERNICLLSCQLLHYAHQLFFYFPLKLLINYLFAYFGKGGRGKVTQCCLKLVWCIWLNECVQVQHLKYKREQRRMLDRQNMSLHLVQFHRLFAFYGWDRKSVV